MLLAKTIETTGFVNHQHQLLLDELLPITESRVCVIVIVAEETQPTESEKPL